MSRFFKILCALSLLLLLITAVAYGEEWAFIIEINNIHLFIDKESVIYPAYQISRAWRKYELETPQTMDSKEFNAVQVYTEEDCSANKFRVLEEVVSFTDETEKKNNYPEAKWEDIAPDTFNYHLHAAVCK